MTLLYDLETTQDGVSYCIDPGWGEEENQYGFGYSYFEIEEHIHIEDGVVEVEDQARFYNLNRDDND